MLYGRGVTPTDLKHKPNMTESLVNIPEELIQSIKKMARRGENINDKRNGTTKSNFESTNALDLLPTPKFEPEVEFESRTIWGHWFLDLLQMLIVL